ncbi:hypothetical protein WA577_003609 [Blastocystis sp. JDR]
MPILGLYLKAEVENVESIEAGKDTIWSAFVQCTNCGERSANRVELSPNDEVEVPDSRSTCNCLYKCKGCKRKIVINVVTDFPSQCTSFEEPGLIAKFEVKGAELVDFQPDDSFRVHTPSGEVFDHVDLQEDFADFDGARSSSD